MWPTADPGPAKRPGVIVFHGGGWIESTKETTMNSLCTPYLNQGFVVCNVEYRVAKEGLAPAAVNDALDAARWFYDRADHYGFDPKRLVVTGASAGGHLALMVGMTPESARLGPITPIAAIINGYGPPDVNDLLAGGAHHQSWADQWLGNQPDIQGLAKSLSPLTYVRPGLPACFTVQGSNDHTVPVPDNQKLTAALKAAGDDADMMLVPGAGHGFTTQWPQVNAQIFAFLRQRGIIQTAAPTTAAVSPSSQPATH
jgi:acetyl esterase/lipase